MSTRAQTAAEKGMAMTDGARSALLGYLYQFIGTTALRALVTPDGDGAAAELLAKVRAGRLVHEVVGQDAVVYTRRASTDEAVLIQFKYSADPSNHLSERELIEILCRFDRSTEAAARANDSITSYVLITNRTLELGARALLAAGGSSAPPPALTLPAVYRGHPHKTNTPLLADYPDPVAAAVAWFEVLNHLSVLEGVSFASCSHALRTFAASHGVLAEEFTGRVAQTIGMVLEETTHGPLEIDSAWLLRHLVGAADAVPLAFGPGSVASAAFVAVNDRLGRTNVPAHPGPVRREVLEELHQATLRSPVVLLLGLGGCGKSVLALQYLSGQGQSQVALSSPAEEVSEESLLRDFSRLRSPGNGLRPDPTIDTVLRRLREANPSARSVLLIDIDGLEEAGTLGGHPVRQLVRAYWNGGCASGVTILVSCRPNETRREAFVGSLLGRLFDCADSSMLRDQVPVVWVEDFTRVELAEAARALGPAYESFAEWLLAQDAPLNDATASSGPDISYPERLVESLRHPVVWGAFAGLPELDRQRVLDGDPDGQAMLASGFLARFRGKCRDRQPGFHENHADAGLIAVAQSTRRPPPYSRRGDWIARASSVLGAQEAAFLFGEAVTYGLVEQESQDGWRWRHPFVADHLAGLDEP